MIAAMNRDIKDDQLDAELILLPGSKITRQGIEAIAEISNFDPYIIQNKLKIKLPQILCPVNSRKIIGTSGDRLKSAGIHFLAVKKNFLALPFNPFVVSSCRFGEKRSRFYNREAEPVEIYNEEKILLIEGNYRTTEAEPVNMPEKDFDFKTDQKKVKTVRSQDQKIYRFIMLYQVMDMNPLIFIDRLMDYTFLEFLKKMTVMANFDCVRHQLETTFSRTADSSMVEHGYVLEQVRRLTEVKTKKLTLKSNQAIITTAISYEKPGNRMSRLMF